VTSVEIKTAYAVFRAPLQPRPDPVLDQEAASTFRAGEEGS